MVFVLFPNSSEAAPPNGAAGITIKARDLHRHIFVNYPVTAYPQHTIATDSSHFNYPVTAYPQHRISTDTSHQDIAALNWQQRHVDVRARKPYRSEGTVTEAIQSLARTHPYVALVVFKNFADRIIGQTISCTK